MKTRLHLTPAYWGKLRAGLLPAVFALVLLGLLAGCASGPGLPAPVEEREEVETRVRTPASQDSAGVQVFPLQNPAVRELLTGASTAESQGDLGQAAVLLERAMRIQPRDPEILQSMAEVQLQMKDYEQALNFAVRSYDSGPRVGEICSRNWRTIGVARDNLGDRSGSLEAQERARACMNTKPAGF
ncbi:MAG: tetratricopeptide repeat protein [Xanthomonadales bacterium]|nr:tetratricopeptide repeat protein [Xanthomonadales bacterium]